MDMTIVLGSHQFCLQVTIDRHGLCILITILPLSTVKDEDKDKTKEILYCLL